MLCDRFCTGLVTNPLKLFTHNALNHKIFEENFSNLHIKSRNQHA